MSNAFVNCRDCGGVNDSRNTICSTCGYQFKSSTLSNDPNVTRACEEEIAARRENQDKLVGSLEVAVNLAVQAIDHGVSFSEKLQHRIGRWVIRCFGPQVAQDKRIRNLRFLEEAVELVQSLGLSKAEACQVLIEVYERPMGEPFQETGGVITTLAALCEANGLDYENAGEAELRRISHPDMIAKIRLRQLSKIGTRDVAP